MAPRAARVRGATTAGAAPEGVALGGAMGRGTRRLTPRAIAAPPAEGGLRRRPAGPPRSRAPPGGGPQPCTAQRASSASIARMRSSVLGWLISQAGAAPPRPFTRRPSFSKRLFWPAVPIPDFTRSAEA